MEEEGREALAAGANERAALFGMGSEKGRSGNHDLSRIVMAYFRHSQDYFTGNTIFNFFYI